MPSIVFEGEKLSAATNSRPNMTCQKSSIHTLAYPNLGLDSQLLMRCPIFYLDHRDQKAAEHLHTLKPELPRLALSKLTC
jgi:hypothetical protein